MAKRRISKREKLRRERISRSMKAYWRKRKKAETKRQVKQKAKKRQPPKPSPKPKQKKRKVAPPAKKKAKRKAKKVVAAFAGGTGSYARVAEVIGQALNTSRDRILGHWPKLDVSVLVHQNLDGSVDGELTIRKIPRGTDLYEFVLDLEESIKAVRDTWISIGYRFAPDVEAEKENYNRVAGLLQVQTYYSRAKNFGSSMVGARDMVRNISEAGRRKPEQIFFRVHWNPEGRNPRRKLTPAEVRDIKREIRAATTATERRLALEAKLERDRAKGIM